MFLISEPIDDTPASHGNGGTIVYEEIMKLLDLFLPNLLIPDKKKRHIYIYIIYSNRTLCAYVNILY